MFKRKLLQLRPRLVVPYKVYRGQGLESEPGGAEKIENFKITSWLVGTVSPKSKNAPPIKHRGFSKKQEQHQIILRAIADVI